MPLPVNTIAEACNVVGRQVKDRYRNLTIHYIIHREGRRAEALGMAGQEIVDHPAAETALHLLTGAQRAEGSALIGVAVAREHLFMGLATRDSLLALCTINADQYDSASDARSHARHLAWHAIDALSYHANPSRRSGQTRELIVRRRNGLEISGANLQADVFTAVMGRLSGERNGVKHLGALRGLAALQAHSEQDPEHFPFLLAMEASRIAMEQLQQGPVPRRRQIDAALRVARQIGKTFDDESLMQWLAFAEPAQELAWRGFNPAHILGLALSTSENVNVRSTGHLVAEATKIKPAAAQEVQGLYSPFADDQFNQRLHEKTIQACFRDVIAEGLRQNSALPFIEAANRQNLRLLDGNSLGWCAGALQNSATAFNSALTAGKEVESTARHEFEHENARTTWLSLRDFGKKIIDNCRHGRPATLQELAEMNKDDRHLAAVRKSLELTLRDPAHKPEMAAPAPAPAAAAPAPVRAPAYLSGAPGMGGPKGGGGFRPALATVGAGRPVETDRAAAAAIEE